MSSDDGTTPATQSGGAGLADMPLAAKALAIAGWIVAAGGAIALVQLAADYQRPSWAVTDQTAFRAAIAAALPPIGWTLAGLAMVVLAQIAGYLAVLVRRGPSR